jgi:hypothetical protein
MHNVSLSAAQGFVSDFPANFVHEAQGRPGRSHLWGGTISTSTPPRRRMFSKSTSMLSSATWVQSGAALAWGRCGPAPGLAWGGHGMSAVLPCGVWDARGLALCRAGGRAWGQLAHAWGLCLALRQPFRRHRHRQRSDTPPLLGGGLCLSGFLGPIYPDETRQSPTFTQKAMSAAVLFADAAFCRRHFCGFCLSPCNRWHFPILLILHDRMSQVTPAFGVRGHAPSPFAII